MVTEVISVEEKADASYVILKDDLLPVVNVSGPTAEGKGVTVDQIKNYVDSRVNVRSFGALGDGVNDDTAFIQAAVDASLGHSTIYFPEGTYLVTSIITVSLAGVYFQGSSLRGTQIKFHPTASGVCFEWVLTQSQGGCKDMNFVSTDRAFVKTAIHFIDGSDFHISHVQIGESAQIAFAWGDITGQSIGIQTNGREVVSMHNLRIFADKPIVHGVNPNHAELDVDQFHLYDNYLVVTQNIANAQIEILDNVNVFNFSVDGYNAWAKGRYGIYWHNTTNSSAVTSRAIKIEDVRCEQGYEGGGDSYLIYIEHNDLNVEQVTINNVTGDVDRQRGIYIKGAREISMSDVGIINNVGSNVPLEIVNNASGGKLKYIEWDNCVLGQFGGTSVIPTDDLTLLGSIPSYDATYSLPLSAKYRFKEAQTNQEKGVGVAESQAGELVTKNYFGATLIAAQTDATGDLTISNTANTITSGGNMDFTGILKGHRVYLNTPANTTTYLAAASDATALIITFDAATVTDEVGVNGDVVHGLGLWHRSVINYIQQTNITAYAPSLGPANRAQTLNCASGTTGNNNSVASNSAILEAHDTTTGALTADIITHTAITSPAVVFNNLTATPSIVHIAVEQINF